MKVTELGISNEVNPVSKNADLPIEVTEFGISMKVSPKHPENTLSPMDVMPSGMKVFLQPAITVFVIVSMMALQLSLES
jgi:hypothetical protein